MNNYAEHKLVQKCLQQIEERLGWGNSAKWHNDVFIELSEIIHQNTNVLLSPTTLKRVWGKINYNSAPSISTLNTLAQFAGFTNWRDFKNKAKTKNQSWIVQKIASNVGIITMSAAIMTLVFISLYSMTGKRNINDKIDFSKVTFSSQPVTEGLPNSVIFNLNLGSIESDSIHIQQFWDVTKTVSLKQGQKQATGIYYYPGYFGAKLLVDGRIIKEHDLFIKSNGWIGTIDYTPVPKYFNADSLRVGASLLNEIKLNKEHLVSSFHFVKNFGKVSGDNLSISTAVQNLLSDKWAVCQKLRIVILGTEGALIIPFSIPGCVSDIGLMLNEKYLNGKEHDLSAFGIDLSFMRNIVINIKEQVLKVSVDGQEIYRDSYKVSIGNFVGIRYRFLGAGQVHYIRINNIENDTIVSENFSNSP